MPTIMNGRLPKILFRQACRGIVALFVLFLWIGNSAAVDILDGKVFIHGKVIAQVGVHLQDSQKGGPDFESGDFSMAQTIADIETTFVPTDIIRFSAIVRAYKEWVYDVSDAYESRYHETGMGFLDPYGVYSKRFNRNSSDWGEDVELREAFADVSLMEYGNLRLGKQQITWGEADGIRLADIINPVNIARHFNLEPWEDLRIPIVAAYANLTHPALSDFILDVIVTGDYERAVRGEPGSGSPWAFPIPNAARGFNPWGADMMPYFVYDEPDDYDDNYEYGARIRYKSQLAGIEFSAFYFHTTNDMPILEFRGGFLPPPSPAPPIPGPGGTFLPEIFLKYKKYDNFGFTFNAFVAGIKTVLRGEFVYIKDIEFNKAVIPNPAVDIGTLLGFSSVETDQIKGMVGFDRQVYIPFLNPSKSFFVSGQYFYLFTDDRENLIDATYGDQGIQEVTQVLTLKMNTAYMMERLVPDALIIVSPDDEWWQVQSSLTFVTTGFHWSYTLGGNFMGGESNFEEFGLFERHNEVYLKVKYSF
ncbi:MAG: hypothetical protein JRH15_03875 [Deltaproteobacteria bacterium]|nr:hypothetical protein [Deltaproteobacteria bacterium]